MTGFYLAEPVALGSDECDAAIALGTPECLVPAPVYAGDGAMMVPMMRDAGSALIERSETVRLFARLDALFARGADTFGLPVGRITEPIQVVRYGTGGHFQMWHSDAGGDRLELRHISTSVELSDLADQDTGALEVVPVLVGVPRRLELAGAPIFPSQALHQVGPVPRGTRWPLVAWTG